MVSYNLKTAPSQSDEDLTISVNDKTERCDKTTNLFAAGVERLEPGRVPREYLTLLFGLLRPSDAVIREAVADHLCDGVLQATAAEKYRVKQGSISRQVNRLKAVNDQVCALAKYHK